MSRDDSGAEEAGRPGPAAALVPRAILSLTAFFLLLAAALFLPAGIGWWQGWLFLAVFAIQMVSLAAYIWCRNPELFAARSRIQKGTKWWDRLLFCVLQVLILAVFPVAGCDERFHGSSASWWVFTVGYVLLSVGMAGVAWVMRVNKFAEMSVRIQTDRGHAVVDSGPYALVRHPFYLAGCFLFFGIPLALGSYWALIPTAMTSLVLVLRTVWEDRTLQHELPGYKEYARRVRYRLIPGMW